MYTSEFEPIFSRHNIFKANFLGAFPSDKIPTKINDLEFFIANTKQVFFIFRILEKDDFIIFTGHPATKEHIGSVL